MRYALDLAGRPEERGQVPEGALLETGKGLPLVGFKPEIYKARFG